MPLGDADPVKASALADAGLAPYHAIKLALPKLNKAGSTALVIGLGGLGLLAVQILKAMKTVGTNGRVTIVGLGAAGSDYNWQWYKEPYEAELVKTYWGTLPELNELVALLQQGDLEPQYTTYTLDEGLDAYQKLLNGEVSGRAIIVPNERF